MTIYFRLTAQGFEPDIDSAVITITKAPSAVTAKPVARTDLVYTGEPQELVKAGAANGGTMYYAVTTEKTIPDDRAFRPEIARATDTGTYCVWYKVVGDDNHTDIAVDPAPIYVVMTSADKDALTTEIYAAENYHNNELRGHAEYSAVAAKLQSAIDAATAVKNNPNASPKQISDAAEALKQARATAEVEKVAADKKKADDLVVAKKVSDAIAALPEKAGEDDKVAVEAARASYDALTDDQKALVGDDMMKKLRDAEKPFVDADAAKAVTDAIEALPEDVDADDKEAVEAARKAFDALTDDQKALVGDDMVKKLRDAEDAVKAAKKAADEAAAKAVADAIEALPADADADDQEAVEAARKAFDDLTDDQEALVADDMEKKLADAEAAVKAAVEAAEKSAMDVLAAKVVTDAIMALPEKPGVNDKAAVETARALYDALTEGQKALVSSDVVKKLRDAVASVKAAEKAAADAAAAKAVAEAIAALPADADADDQAAVEAARKAFDDLTDEQEDLVADEVEKKLTDAEASVKTDVDTTAAKTVTEAIAALPEKADADDQEAVEAARKAFDDLTDDQEALVAVDVVAKLTAAEQQVQAAEEAAKLVDISACRIAVKDRTYTGARIKKPSVNVEYGGRKLAEGTDYTISYNKKAKAVGTYKLTVSGIGQFTGEKQVTFRIIPKGTAFTDITGGKKQVTLSWKRRKNVTGYQIEYSLNKDFSGKKRTTILADRPRTRTIKHLKAGRKYYVRIRTYTKVGNKNYYSAWSEVEKVKTKGGKAKNASTEAPVEVTLLDFEGGDVTLEIDGGLDQKPAAGDTPVEIEEPAA